MHCNLRPPELRQPFPALIRTPCRIWSRWTYPLPYYSVLLLIHYFALWPWLLTPWLWPLISDLEHLQCIACNVMKRCIKFERSRAIRGSVIAISVFDLVTLSITLRVALGSEIISTKFDLRQFIGAWKISFFMVIRNVTLWSWPFTRWPWKFVVHQASCDRSLYEIWAKSSNPGWIIDNFANFYTRHVFTPLTLSFYNTSGVMCVNSVPNLSEIE